MAPHPCSSTPAGTASASSMTIHRLLLSVKNVYLHDHASPSPDFSILFPPSPHDSFPFVSDDASLQQMSELGLPTSFSTTSFYRGWRQKKKSKAPSRSPLVRNDDDPLVALLRHAGDRDSLVVRSDSKFETVCPKEASECWSHGSVGDPAIATNGCTGIDSMVGLPSIEASEDFFPNKDTPSLHQTVVAVSAEKALNEGSGSWISVPMERVGELAMAANDDAGFDTTVGPLTFEASEDLGCDDDIATIHQTEVAVSTEKTVLESLQWVTDEDPWISTPKEPVVPFRETTGVEWNPDSLLPWVPYWDDFYGRYYFYNTETSETAWEIPLNENMREDESFSAGPHCQPNGKENVALDILDEIITSVVESESADQSKNLVAKKYVRKTRRKKKACALQMRLDNQYGNDAGGCNASLLKYWVQRYHLFSKFDAGLKLDEEGWFSVTPEVIAKHHAARCHQGVIVDAFTGVGGNAIQFALAGHYVVAIDSDPRKIQYAQHNAMIYGVSNFIDFILGDFFSVSASLCADVIFLSPPWGGPEYLDVKVYDIDTMLQPIDGTSLFRVAKAVAPNVILFLPRNVDMNQLLELSEKSSQPCVCEVERNFLNGKLKAVTAYYGRFVCMEEMSALEQ